MPEFGSGQPPEMWGDMTRYIGRYSRCWISCRRAGLTLIVSKARGKQVMPPEIGACSRTGGASRNANPERRVASEPRKSSGEGKRLTLHRILLNEAAGECVKPITANERTAENRQGTWQAS
jgi:hypothetical protein